jgi:hypothetical protein
VMTTPTTATTTVMTTAASKFSFILVCKHANASA